MHDDFLRLLEKRHENPEAIDEEIWNRFGVERAVMITDMTGFSRVSKAKGILHFLSLIKKMRDICVPLVEKVGGEFIKAEADNLYAAFPDPESAVRSALAMHDKLAAEPEIFICAGIGYGRILHLGHDMFGEELNYASKLGEDIAEPEETLLTHSAFEASPSIDGEEREMEISGVALKYWSVSPSTVE